MIITSVKSRFSISSLLNNTPTPLKDRIISVGITKFKKKKQYNNNNNWNRQNLLLVTLQYTIHFWIIHLQTRTHTFHLQHV